MKSLRKIILLILAFILSASLFSCSVPEEKYILVNGEKLVPEYVLKVNGENVSFDEYRYFYLSVLSTYDITSSTKEELETIKSEVLDYILANYAANISANEFNITLTETEKNDVDVSLDSMKDRYGNDDDFEKALKANYLTEELYKSFLSKQTLQNKLFNHLFSEGGPLAYDDNKYREYFEENYICISHIFLEYGKNENMTECEETYQNALALKDRIDNGEDFFSLVTEYGKDEEMKKHPNGYYIKEGIMSETFFSTALNLEIGETSDVYCGNNGIYLIKRLPITEEGMANEKEAALFGYYDANDNWFPGAYESDFVKYCKEKAATLQVEFNDCYSVIAPDTIF